MKRNKVLLGLYVGLLTLAGGVANAQTGNKFFEIGPANVGGHVSSLCVDRQDTNNTTIYAGAATGGLFVKSADTVMLRNIYSHISGIPAATAAELATNTGIWHRVPFVDASGHTLSLPISSMIQGPDNTIFIGTGSDAYAIGNSFSKRSMKGSGIYRFNPNTGAFKVIPATVNDNFAAVHDMNYIYRDNILYLYFATSKGLYRISVPDGSQETFWNTATAKQIYAGNVDQVVISSSRRTAYFTDGNKLFSIADATLSDNAIEYNDISASNSAFGGTNTAIKLAISHATATFPTTYLYAMVIKANGLMDALYLSTDGQTWSTLTTTSIMPLTYNSGKVCGAIAIDPGNPRRVAIAGTNVQVGEGFVEGAYYQWTQASASEYELNSGDYMSSVYNSYSFVHSGIHQILPVNRFEDGERHMVYYFATDGGVYSTSNDFLGFTNENRGLNNVQINDLAVSPDGTIISGANSNACPVIEAQLDHNVDSVHRANQERTWYNDGSILINNDANIIWKNNGGGVAASAFQQLSPESRRVIFTSSEGGSFGRSYADYLDYRVTNTWTTGSSLMTRRVGGGFDIAHTDLWETNSNNIFNDSVTVSIDTLGYIFRKRGSSYDTVWLAVPGTTRAVRFEYRDSVTSLGEHVTIIDTIPVGTGRGGHFQIKATDRAVFTSRANSEYPFVYQFTAADVAGTRLAVTPIKVLNPIQARMIVTAYNAAGGSTGGGEITSSSVFYAWRPTDFTKVFDVNEPDDEKKMWWADILSVTRTSGTEYEHSYARTAAFSADGRYVYAATYDVNTHKSMLFRISGFENVDYSASCTDIYTSLHFDARVENPVLTIDTLRYNGSKWIDRPISSITFDKRDNQDRVILTFDEYCDTMPNVMIVNNATGNYYFTPAAVTGNANIPAYCALVEDSTGTIYVGTEKGVYTSATGSSWNVYSKLTGVPVTVIRQQTNNLPIYRTLTHTGINANHMVFAKTKWPRAIYFGTYGRGIFMDMTYVTDTTNEVSEPQDYNPVDIPVVRNTGVNSVNLYPNPVYGDANLAVNAAVAGNGVLRVYDLNGRCVMNRNLGYVAQGEQLFTISTEGMAKGMYLINVIISGHTATAKMMVR